MSDKRFSVRRLGPGDVADVRLLNRLFGQEFEDQDTYGAHPPDDAYLNTWLAKPNVLALAAINGGTVIGGLVAYEFPKFEQERSELYIYDLAVAGVHRRQGVATALIHEARKIASEMGAWVAMVQADPVDEPAVRLYSKLGIREDVLHFDLPALPRSD